jgi:molybdopterin converting factor subunit 1
MILTIRLFARVRDLAGADALSVELPAGATVGDLRATVATRYPALAGLLRHSVFAVNNEFATDTLVLPPTAEIALLPPVSGG